MQGEHLGDQAGADLEGRRRPFSHRRLGRGMEDDLAFDGGRTTRQAGRACVQPCVEVLAGHEVRKHDRLRLGGRPETEAFAFAGRRAPAVDEPDSLDAPTQLLGRAASGQQHGALPGTARAGSCDGERDHVKSGPVPGNPDEANGASGGHRTSTASRGPANPERRPEIRAESKPEGGLFRAFMENPGSPLSAALWLSVVGA